MPSIPLKNPKVYHQNNASCQLVFLIFYILYSCQDIYTGRQTLDSRDNPDSVQVRNFKVTLCLDLFWKRNRNYCLREDES